MSDTNLSAEVLAAALMAVEADYAFKQYNNGRGFAAAASVAKVAQTGSIIARSQQIDNISSPNNKVSDNAVRAIQNSLEFSQAAGDLSHTISTAQCAVDLTNPSSYTPFKTPLDLYFVYSYVEKSLNSLGSLSGVKGLPDLLKSLILSRQK